MASVIFFNGTLITSPGDASVEVPDTPGLQGEPNKNIDITCFPEWYKQMNLEWSIPSQWGDCKFNVYFSPHESGDFTQLNTVLLTEPFYAHGGITEYSKFRHGFYIVEVVRQSDGMHAYSFPSTWQTKSRTFIQKRISEIQRREYLLLTKFVGVKSFLFKRKPYGAKCPRCWSDTLEKAIEDHCPVCYGTSFEGGYFDPLVIFIQYEPTPNELTRGYFGEFEPNQIGAWTISFPYIGPDDIVIRSGDWNVYQVTRVSNTELQTNTVRQMLTLTQLAKFDIENNLIVKTEAGPNYLDLLGGDFSTQRFPRAPVDQNVNNEYTWSPGTATQKLPMPTQDSGGSSGNNGSGGQINLHF